MEDLLKQLQEAAEELGAEIQTEVPAGDYHIRIVHTPDRPASAVVDRREDGQPPRLRISGRIVCGRYEGRYVPAVFNGWWAQSPENNRVVRGILGRNIRALVQAATAQGREGEARLVVEAFARLPKDPQPRSDEEAYAVFQDLASAINGLDGVTLGARVTERNGYTNTDLRANPRACSCVTINI